MDTYRTANQGFNWVEKEKKKPLSKIHWFIETGLGNHNSVTLLSIDDYRSKICNIKKNWDLILLFRIICGPF